MKRKSGKPMKRSGWHGWDPSEYMAGYVARMSKLPKSDDAHLCWRIGWKDADTELLELARHEELLAQGETDSYPHSWDLLVDVGGQAWANGLSFDPKRAEPWKEGWIMMDVHLGRA